MEYQSLHGMTVVELRKLAKLRMVKVPAGTTKAMLVELLIAAERRDTKDEKDGRSEPERETNPQKAEESAAEKAQAPTDPSVPAPLQIQAPCAAVRRSGPPGQGFGRGGDVRQRTEPRFARRDADGQIRHTAYAASVRERKPAGEEPCGSGADAQQRRECSAHAGVAAGDFACGSGVLEILSEGFGLLRAENYLPGNRDVYISMAQIRRFGLRNGDFVEGKIRPKREGDRYGAMMYIERINGETPEKAAGRRPFDALIPVYPDQRWRLEHGRNADLSLRLIDMLAPIGKGQRGMIVSQPKAGKTTLLKKIANAISESSPDAELIVLLIDERPEEVTDMKRSIRGEVVYSTFDEAPENHVRVSELVLEHVQRTVESGRDAVILLDSITRLARAYNMVIPPTGRSLSGGLDPGALHKPKRFFGAARCIEGGGSLTIIATALVDTGSRMDDIIYEEFKGTGNMELHLDRRLSERRIFPAIDLVRSGTRREELLLTPKELEGASAARRLLSNGSAQQSAEMLISLIEKTETNEEAFGRILGWQKAYEKDGFCMAGGK